MFHVKGDLDPILKVTGLLLVTQFRLNILGRNADTVVIFISKVYLV